MEAKRKTGEISQEEYDQWRYHYPEFDTSGQWVKVPSQALSDFLVEALTEEEEKKNKWVYPQFCVNFKSRCKNQSG